MKKSIRTMLIVFCLVLSFNNLRASEALVGTKFLADYPFQTITTEHFYIHFPENLHSHAALLAEISEDVHVRLSPKEQWMPKGRTHVILIDSQDSANGYAWSSWKNNIVMYLSEPAPESGLSSYKSWLTLLFVHEYTHTLNIDQARGIPAALRYVIGRLYFPNATLPIFYIEGNAVYNESYQSGYGRLNSPYTDMILRMDFLSGSPKTLAESCHYTNSWPFGNVPYLYGARFIEYLADRFGEKAVKDFYYNSSDNIIPYFQNSVARETFGYSFDNLWKDWSASERRLYQAQAQKIMETGLTPATRLTEGGMITRLPRFFDNNEVVYYRYNGISTGEIASFNIKKRKSSRLSQANSPLSIAIDENNEIYTADFEYNSSHSFYADLFSTKSGYRRITKKRRTISADVYGSSAVYIRQDAGLFSMETVSLKAPEKRTVLIPQSEMQLYHCRYSPDGKQIIFGYRMGERSGIAIHTPANGETISLIEQEALHIYPVLAPGGNELYFSSDSSGVFNLYRLKLNTGNVSRITNVLGGVFSFDISPDGRNILYSGYNHEGFDLYLLRLDKSQQFETKQFPAGALLVQNYKPNKPAYKTAENYSPPRHMFPPALMPIIYSEETGDNVYDTYIGAQLYTADPLAHHELIVQGASGLSEEKANLFASYTYGRLYPDLTLQYNDRTLFWGEESYPQGNPKQNLQRRLPRQISAILTIPFVQYDYASALSFYFTYEKERVTNYYLSIDDTRTFWVNNSHTGALYQFSSLKQTPFTPVPHSGLTFSCDTEFYSEYVGADYTYFSSYGMTQLYTVPLIFKSIASLQGKYGYIHNVDTDVNSFSLGRYKSTGSEPLVFNEQSLGLRGYPAGAYTGSRLAGGTVDYSAPLIISDFGYSTLPLFFRSLYTTVFTDFGSVWGGNSDDKLHYSAGIELNSMMTLAYRYDLRFFAGFAKGFTDPGEDQYYVGIRSLLYSSVGATQSGK